MRKIDPFLWGTPARQRQCARSMGRRFHVSPRDASRCLPMSERDCAGAVQLSSPSNLNTILGRKPPQIDWLDDAAIAARLRTLRADHRLGACRAIPAVSLAGAQPKTALLFENGCWGVPSGRVPTTHILKPPTGDLDGHVENEHFCWNWQECSDFPSRIPESYTFRTRSPLSSSATTASVQVRPSRVHQEDMCQALAIPPTRKYQNEGGPGIREIVELLTTNSTNAPEDVATFLDSIAFNWLIAGTDAHAKNYALLIGAEGRVRLPRYTMSPAFCLTRLLTSRRPSFR